MGGCRVEWGWLGYGYAVGPVGCGYGRVGGGTGWIWIGFEAGGVM